MISLRHPYRACQLSMMSKVIVILWFFPLAGFSQELPYPIIFIHGISSNANTWEEEGGITDFLRDDAQLGDGFYLNICLERDGDWRRPNLATDTTYFFDVGQIPPRNYYLINFDVNPDGSPGTNVLSNQAAITKQGAVLQKAIAAVLRATKKDKVILVGHSMGGLAAREYIQNSAWHQPDGKSHVAKLVTIGTPHLGSNAAAELGKLLPEIDQKSDASRDLAYDYDFRSTSSRPPDPKLDNAVYLFGGFESQAASHEFYSFDINCNGVDDLNRITGLNERAWPADVDYFFIRGRHPFFQNIGDGAVRLDRQLPYLDAPNKILEGVYHSYNMMIGVVALTRIDLGLPSPLPLSYEFKKVQDVIFGMDEPNQSNRAFHIGVDTLYTGFHAYDLTGPAGDKDWYRFTLRNAGTLRGRFENFPTSGANTTASIRLFAANNLSTPVVNVNNMGGVEKIEFEKRNMTSGDYLVELFSSGTEEEQSKPYSFIFEAIGSPTQFAIAAQNANLPANPTASTQIIAELRDEQSRIATSAINPVTFTITSGAISATLVGPNPLNAVGGVATIQLQPTTTPGTVEITASSPGLISATTTVNIFGTSTIVGGPITTNTTWDFARSPFEVTSDVTVYSGATLAIEPGVVVLFHNNTQLRIGNGNNAGALIADGNQASRILFTSFSGDNNDWKGIVFDDGSDNGKTSSMTWCSVEKAGQPNSYGVKAEVYCFSTAMPTMSSCTVGQPLSFENSGNALYLDSSSPAISHTTFYNSGGLEVVHLSRRSSPSFTNCVFTGSGSPYWIYSSHNDCNPIISSCTFNGSVNKAVRLGTYFQMSGNNFQGSRSPELEVWGGQMSSSRTWRKQNGGSIYAVVGSSYHVYDGNGNLTIEPGVTVKFASGTGLLIAADAGPGRSFEGYLTAQGTVSEPIIFTSLTGTDGSWQGILFDDDSDIEGSSLMRYFVVEKAGEANRYGSTAAIYCRSTTTPTMSNMVVRNNIGPSLHLTNASLSISHSTFSHIGSSEVVLLTESSSPSFTNCMFTGNGASYWLNSSQGDCNPNISSCTFNGSVNKAVRLGTYFQMSGNNFQGALSPEIEIWGGQMSSSRTWRKQNGGSIYAVVGSSYHVYDGNGNLTIEQGVTVKFASGTGLIIAADAGPGSSFEGYLTAQGTASEPIIFTSLTGANGGWQGILFDDDSDLGVSSVMSYCIIEKTGQPNVYGISAAIYCRRTSTPTLSQITIRNNGGNGLYLEISSPRLTNSYLSDNSLAAIRIVGNSNPAIGNAYGASNNIFGSGGRYDLENVGPNSINACYNFWGTVDSTQIATRILDKADNQNYGLVFYEPWTDSAHVAVFPDKTPPFPPNKVFAWNDASQRMQLVTREPYSYTNPYFVWSGAKDLSGIAGYSVSFTADSLATPQLTITHRDSFFSVTQTLRTNTKYFLRLRARDNVGNWSGPVTLFVYLYRPSSNNPPSTPVVLLPKQSEELKPEGLLVWSQSRDSDPGDVITYTLQIDNDSTFVSPEVNHSGIGNNASPDSERLSNASAENNLQATNAVAVRLDTLRGYSNLADNVIYFWRVQAYDNRGGISQFTSGRDQFFFNKVNTAPGPVTEGFSPRGGTEVRLSRPEISWFPAIDPDKSDHSGTLRYNLQIKSTPDFLTAPRFSYHTKMGLNTFQVPDSLDENTRWYWRVQTVDDEGLISNWSAIQNFFVNAIKEPPKQFEILSPVNNFIALSDTVIFKWQATSDPDPFDSLRYVVEWSTNRNFSSFIKLSLKSAAAEYAFVRPSRIDSVFWRLYAIDADTLSTYASNSKTQPRLIRWRGTSVDTRESILPIAFSLRQNYPNPFNPATTIEFALPQRTRVAIRFFNLAGAEIRTLVNEPKEPGHHKVTWDGKDAAGQTVPSGVYLYKIQAGEFVAVRKCVVVR